LGCRNVAKTPRKTVIRYDTIRDDIITFAQKLTGDQLSLAHGNKKTKKISKKRKQKTGYADRRT